MIKNNNIFKNFTEYWHFARNLSEKQRKTIFDCLPDNQQKALNSSYTNGAWEDVICRNALDKIINRLEYKYNYNILDIRCKVLSGKSAYVSKEFWDVLNEEIEQYKIKHINYMISGLEAIECEKNTDVVLIVKFNTKN